jgi:hypothetical protein
MARFHVVASLAAVTRGAAGAASAPFSLALGAPAIADDQGPIKIG